MFTGIITNIGIVQNIIKNPNRDLLITLKLENKNIAVTLENGCSVACSGMCLTLIKKEKIENYFHLDFQVSHESITASNISGLKIGDKINIEFPLKIGDELGGHLVSGHVDGTSKIKSIKKINDSHEFIFEIPKGLEKFICEKGSITINGISLTVNDVNENSFAVNIIPHTFQNTNLCDLKIGDKVNLEIDQVARYLYRMNFLNKK